MLFVHNWKFVGTQPLPFGLQAGVAFQSYAGNGPRPAAVGQEDPGYLVGNWIVPAALFPGGRTQSVTVNLVPPGSKLPDRWNQLDLTFKKIVGIRNVELQPQVDIFNVTNASTALLQNQTFGPLLGQPTEILSGRIPRVALQVKF